jgi:hypothetical protein
MLLVMGIAAAFCPAQPGVDAAETVRGWFAAAGVPEPVAERVVTAGDGGVTVALDAARLAAPDAFIPGRLDPALGACRLANAARLELDLGERVVFRAVSRRDTEPDRVITGLATGDGWIEIDPMPRGWLPAVAGSVAAAMTGEPLSGTTRASLLAVERHVERVRLRLDHGGTAEIVFRRAVSGDAMARLLARLTGRVSPDDRRWSIGGLGVVIIDGPDGPVVEVAAASDQGAG